jgi:hypothetical protein
MVASCASTVGGVCVPELDQQVSVADGAGTPPKQASQPIGGTTTKTGNYSST